jgi:hypothetical protein
MRHRRLMGRRTDSERHGSAEVWRRRALLCWCYPWGNVGGGFPDEDYFLWPQLEAACDDPPAPPDDFQCDLQRLQILMAKFGVYCEEDDLNPGTCK